MEEARLLGVERAREVVRVSARARVRLRVRLMLRLRLRLRVRLLGVERAREVVVQQVRVEVRLRGVDPPVVHGVAAVAALVVHAPLLPHPHLLATHAGGSGGKLGSGEASWV